MASGSLEKQDYDPNNESGDYYDCLSWHVVQGWEKLLYDPGGDTDPVAINIEPSGPRAKLGQK